MGPGVGEEESELGRGVGEGGPGRGVNPGAPTELGSEQSRTGTTVCA